MDNTYNEVIIEKNDFINFDVFVLSRMMLAS